MLAAEEKGLEFGHTVRLYQSRCPHPAELLLSVTLGKARFSFHCLPARAVLGDVPEVTAGTGEAAQPAEGLLPLLVVCEPRGPE